MNDLGKFYARQHIRALDAEALMDRAVAQCALGHHLDSGLRSRISSIVDRVNARGLLTTDSAPASELQIAGLIATRLAFAETQARHPEIAQEKIERPIVVVGYARTGSTIMHSLLSCDPAGHAPQAWEAYYPSPPPGIAPETMAARRSAADDDIRDLLARVPEALMFHPYFDELGGVIVECDEIFGLDFHNGMVSRHTHSPVCMLDTSMTDPRTAYRFHRDVLKQLQWKRGFGHWVIKGTRHQSYLRELFETYPDAICVYAHRDPNETVGSVLGTAEAFIRGYEGDCDRDALAEGTLANIAAIYDGIVDDPMVDDPRVIHVRFQDFIGDHVGTIRHIYEQASIDFTPAFEQRMRAWLADPANKADRHGKFSYSLADYGIDASAMASKFERYIGRFDLGSR